jgi:hypothetical protein
LEDIVFHTKTKTEQLQETLQDNTASLANAASTLADLLRERVVPAVGQAAGSAKEWAKPHVEHGIEVAAPKLESAVSGLAPKVDTARDKIVDDLLPRVTEAITAFAAASAAAKDEAVSRGTGAAAVISGDAVASPKHKKKCRGVLLGLGLLGGAAAGAAAFMKRSAPKDDPWATPLADPYVAPSARHSGASADRGASATSNTTGSSAATDETEVPDPLDLVADVDLSEKGDADEGPRS